MRTGSGWRRFGAWGRCGFVGGAVALALAVALLASWTPGSVQAAGANASVICSDG